LTKGQLEAIHLPKDGTHLIIGGPGTGKSVVALFRVREQHGQEKTKNYCFLVYNYLLHEASRQLMNGSLESARWISWVKNLFLDVANRPVKVIDGNPWQLDWSDIEEWIAGKESIPNLDISHLIIDEGQDMPPVFYNTLINLGISNFYVVADQNQQITSDNSSRKELEDTLVIETTDVVELKDNHRNTYPIARLAREFYTGDPASPPPDLPEKPNEGTSIATPMLVEYGGHIGFDIQDVIKRILIMSDNYPSKLIGILTHSNKVRDHYFKLLNQISKQIKLVNKPRIVTYASSGNRKKIEDCSFVEGGVFVINANSCKGLEFEIVFIADINDYPCFLDIEDKQKRLFYVMVARAREKVILLKKEGSCRIERILPQDTSVLKRWPERL
jgi:superfamily I DNA/RNA helicase